MLTRNCKLTKRMQDDKILTRKQKVIKYRTALGNEVLTREIKK